jgi:uncharacterized membrane protein
MEIFHQLLGHICHQDPQRSFLWLWNPPLLCARCTGFYSGIIIGFAGYLFAKKVLKIRVMLALTCLAFTFVALNVAIEVMLEIDTGNAIRFLTGIFSGIMVGILFVYNVKKREV